MEFVFTSIMKSLQRICIICTSFILLVLTVAVSHVQTSETLHELCKARNRPLHILQENESEYMVINSSVDLSKHTFSKFKSKCRLEYKVCSSCHFEITINKLTMPCPRTECRCGYFEIEETFPQQRLKFCGNYSESTSYFESKTRHITLDFIQVEDVFSMELNITAKRNHYIITGMSNNQHFIESPFFPAKYPPDYSAEYTFQSLEQKGRVQLLFLDFQILPESYIEVFGHQAYRVDTYTGEIFRPPPLTSEGTHLRFKFDANSKKTTKAGFRAKYKFFRSNIASETPYTDCGGPGEAYGGRISLDVPSKVEQLVDCIWLIYPPLFSQRYLFSAMIQESRNIGKGSVLEFRKGLTSVSSVIKMLECHSSYCFKENQRSEITVSALVGVYIRFRGHMTKESSITISYSTFSERNCNDDEFECANGRCIHKSLHCDGYDHCTDNSDEECQVSTNSVTVTSQSSYVTVTSQSIADVPQIVKEKFPAGITSLIVITALSGLLIVILSLTLIVLKLRKTRSVRRESRQAPLILGVADEPPELHVCQNEENPPSYEVVLKCPGRYPRLSYTSQSDIETQCSFTDFPSANCETAHDSCENSASDGAMQDSDAGPKNPPVSDKSSSFESTAATAHLNFVSSPRRVIHTLQYATGHLQSSKMSAGRLCQSLESSLNHVCCNQKPSSLSRIHVIEHEYVVLQAVPQKPGRCMTLPSGYKLPQRGKGESTSNPGSCEYSLIIDNCSAVRTENQFSQCTCSFIASIPGVIDIFPLSRNRGLSDPYKVTVLDDVQPFFRKKASTF